MRLCMSDQMDCGLSQQPLCAVYIFEQDGSLSGSLLSSEGGYIALGESGKSKPIRDSHQKMFCGPHTAKNLHTQV